jgi:hypothetical protein
LETAELTCRIERKDPSLSRFFVVPGDLVAPWRLERTTIVEVLVKKSG